MAATSREVGEKNDKKAAIKEGNSNGFISKLRLIIYHFGRYKTTRALKQPGK
jgi:hypothetical protein